MSLFNETLTILSVDDSRLVRLQVKKAFTDYHIEFLEAEDGQQGLVMAEKMPDIIFLDITMPVMTGDEMLAKLRATPGIKDIPVIMVSAECAPQNIIRMAKLGSNDFIKKPFQSEDIIRKTERLAGDKLVHKNQIENQENKVCRNFTFNYKYLVITFCDNSKASISNVEKNYQSRLDEALLNRLSEVFIDCSKIEQAPEHICLLIEEIIRYSRSKNMRAYVMGSQEVENDCQCIPDAKNWHFFRPDPSLMQA